MFHVELDSKMSPSVYVCHLEAAVRQLQVKSFEAQLQLAEELRLPVNAAV